jgi:hypothetical protein
MIFQVQYTRTCSREHQRPSAFDRIVGFGEPAVTIFVHFVGGKWRQRVGSYWTSNQQCPFAQLDATPHQPFRFGADPKGIDFLRDSESFFKSARSRSRIRSRRIDNWIHVHVLFALHQ